MLYRIDFKAMGTSMTAMLESPHPQASQALECLPAQFEEWEKILSRFRPGSELNQLNHAAGLPFKVSPTLWDVCASAHEMEHLSTGLVRATLRLALEQAGYDRNFEDIPPTQHTAYFPGWNSAHSLDEAYFNEEEQSICLPAGVQLDFGGVAKGWAAMQALKLLASHGAAMVSAGGDMAFTAGEQNDYDWPISVNDPFHPGSSLATLRLRGGGLATSGRDRRRWVQNRQWKHHIIDPRTCLPAITDVFTITAIAPDAILAEMAAKTGLILGSQHGMDWFNHHEGYHALMVLESGEVRFSKNMPEYFWSENEYRFE